MTLNCNCNLCKQDKRKHKSSSSIVSTIIEFMARTEVPPFPWRRLEFCENLWCWQCDQTALYLRVRTLCRRFCRFIILPLLQSRPLRPFISYRTFYLRFMEHAIRPDILRAPKYQGRRNVFFSSLSIISPWWLIITSGHILRGHYFQNEKATLKICQT